ncbi:hypothetical protein DMH03_31500 [Amycolatopsis sp. WAC 01376]|nr:hypothetical protein DMH03_31500 [Amycolatopsis sp. WAC 01376]
MRGSELREGYSDVQTRRTVASRFKNHILPTFGHLRVCDITLSRVMEWWAEMCEKTKPNGERYATSTLELAYVHFGSFLRTAVKGATKLLPVHPFDGWDVEVPRRDRRVRNIWEQERVNTVLAAMPERERPIGLVSATCGHRQDEAFAVALEDVNRFRKEITIRHQVKRVGGKLVLAKPKGGKVRTVRSPTSPRPPLPSTRRSTGPRLSGARAVTRTGTWCSPTTRAA